MTVVVTHTTPADSTFSSTGAAAWNANHALAGVGTMAEQDANNVAITGGTINNTTIGATTPSTGVFTTLTATGQTSLGGVAGAEGLRVTTTASAANYLLGRGQISGNNPSLRSAGSDTNVSLLLGSQNAGNIRFLTNSLNDEQLRVAHTASAVNYVQVTGAATGVRPTISAQGSDTNAGLNIVTKGSAGIFLGANAGNSYLATFAHSTSAVNYLQINNSATAVAPVLSAQGSDTNIPLVLQPKGTGALQAQQTDSTATGGNARGANAVDFQTLRNGATQVASSLGSVLSGGVNNTSSGNYSVAAGGVQNGSGAFASVVSGGWNNFATANNASIVGGYLNTASGIYSFVGNGQSNTSAGYYNFVGGGFTNSGTANAAVTTQSGTMNATTAVTLSGSNASIKVGQYITGTSISGETYVAAISGTSLTLSKVASGSSTSTLSFFTPHGVVVGGGNNQATGSYSFIGGGGDAGTAANRNVASGDWSVVGGGAKNVASGPASVIVGGGFLGTSIFGNTASADTTFVGGGILNVASNSGAVITGGWQNISNGILSTVGGGRYATARGISGINVFSTTAPIADNWGVSQSSLLIIGRQTTDATATRLTSDTAAASTTNQVILPNNSAYYFKGSVIANVTGAANGAAWSIEGAIMRGANAASTVLIDTPSVNRVAASSGASAWVVAVTADTTNGGLAVTVTGVASTTIRWVASVNTVEVTF